MSVDQVSLLFALLSFLALAIGLGAFGVVISGRTELVRPTLELLLPLAFAIALICTVGSLYYSGIVGFTPCRLCWWQRIMMYPLVPVLLAAAFTRDRLGALYGIGLAVGGLGYSGYHTQLRWFPEQGSSCEAEAACTSVWVNTFGFVSIPFMAGAGFFAILALLTLHLRLARNETSVATTPVAATPVSVGSETMGFQQ